MSSRLLAAVRLPPEPAWAMGAAVLAVAIAAAAVAWQLSASRRLAEAQAAASRMPARFASSALPAAPPDFVQSLPARAAVEDVVRDLHRSSAGVGASFVAVDAVPRSTSALAGPTLGWVDLNVSLRGSYPQIKATLAEVTARHANLVLQRMSLRRLAAPTELEATLVLALVSRPPDADASSR